ncbi:hypothetical protein [Saccharospirillum mangrovi]|uniref:hypothetical protein n=1 Tax=Saccharospirillum mangrovi TaxID=2161747 RepID=UPI0013007332|nr:hypothetical protein [Saccharospirillum mangrovi]
MQPQTRQRIDAIDSRDPNKAVQCMRHHLHDLEQHLNLDFWETRSVDLQAALRPLDAE